MAPFGKKSEKKDNKKQIAAENAAAAASVRSASKQRENNKAFEEMNMLLQHGASHVKNIADQIGTMNTQKLVNDFIKLEKSAKGLADLEENIAQAYEDGDKKLVHRPEEALYQLNFSTSANVDTFQWQTAGNVKIQTENYNIL